MYMIVRVVDALIIDWYLYNTNRNRNSLFYCSKIQSTLIMALSQTIIESLAEANGHIRNALAFAARSERSNTVKVLSNILTQMDTLATTDDILDQLDEFKNNPKTSRGQWIEVDEDEDL